MPTSILVIIMLTLASSPKLALSSHNFPLAKHNCTDSCGNITIPFPFGTTPQCYISQEFWVTCKHTALDPPKLFWWDTDIGITKISLDGQITLLQSIAYDCYRNGVSSSNFGTWINLTDYFTVNNTGNKFTIVGCDAYAYVSGERLNREFSTGCIAMCSSEADLTEGECAGVGCCQVPIPRDAWRIQVEASSFSNYTEVSEFNNCSYAFVAEDSAFKFSKDNLTNLSNIRNLLVVADWVVRNETCEKAMSNATSYSCVSANSECYEPVNNDGYRCRCNTGFEGNHYINNGCRGIITIFYITKLLTNT